MVTAVCAITAAFIYFLRLRPLSIEIEKRHTHVENEIREILERKWPVGPEQLQKLLRQQRNRLNTLKINLAEVQERATGTFAERIKNKYGPDAITDPDNFIHYASSLDYQVYYEEIISAWRDKGVPLEPAVLKLSDDSAAEYIYQSVLQLWSLDKVLKTIAGNGLRPVVKQVRVVKSGEGRNAETVPPSAYQTVRAAEVILQPIRQYKTTEDADTVFLLEMPVELTVRCRLRQLIAFLQSLNNSDSLMPLNAIEIQKIPPRRSRHRQGLLEVKMECGTFYPLRRENKVELKKDIPPLPAGA